MKSQNCLQHRRNAKVLLKFPKLLFIGQKLISLVLLVAELELVKCFMQSLMTSAITSKDLGGFEYSSCFFP